jgi:Arc/MetJ-type ribon-helix-helix transcriptional regulator
MMIRLPENLEGPIRDAVRNRRYVSLDAAMSEAAALLIERLNQEPTQATPIAASHDDADSKHRPVWEIIEEENRSILPKVRDALPIDLSEQHDHYVYGTPKRPAE